MKSIRTMLAFLILLSAVPAIAQEETPDQIKKQLQTAYDQSQRSLDKNDIDGYLDLYADDYSSKAPSGDTIGKDQVREIANATVKRAKRATMKVVVDKVEFVDVTEEGVTRKDTVATVFQTMENEAVDKEGKRVKKTLKLTFKDTVVKNGERWQIQLREPQ